MENTEGSGSQTTASGTQTEAQVFSSDYVKALRGEAADYRTKNKTLAEQLEAVNKQLEGYKTKESDYQKQIQDFQVEKKNSVLKTVLSEKVLDVDKALKLIDDSHYENGEFKIEKFLEGNSFLAKNSTVVNNKVENKDASTQTQIVNQDVEQLNTMTKEQLIAFFNDYNKQK